MPVGKLTLYVPQTWGQQRFAFPDFVFGVSTAVGRATAYSNSSVRSACVATQNGVCERRTVVHYADPTRIDPLLDSKVAGRPAQIDDQVNTDIRCPQGTASSVHVVVGLGGGNYAGILGCLGPSDAARAAFQKLLDSARFTG